MAVMTMFKQHLNHLLVNKLIRWLKRSSNGWLVKLNFRFLNNLLFLFSSQAQKPFWKLSFRSGRWKLCALVIFGHTSSVCFFLRPPFWYWDCFQCFVLDSGYFQVDFTLIGPRYLWSHFFNLLLLTGSRCFSLNVLIWDLLRFKR